MNWWLSVLIALDQLLNALTCGWPDETLSARAYREQRRFLQATINGLFFWQPNHCRHSYEREQQNKQLAPSYRDET